MRVLCSSVIQYEVDWSWLRERKEKEKGWEVIFFPVLFLFFPSVSLSLPLSAFGSSSFLC